VYYFHRSSLLGSHLKDLGLTKPQATQVLNPSWRTALQHASRMASQQGLGAGADSGLGFSSGPDSGAVSDSSAGLALLCSLDGEDAGAADAYMVGGFAAAAAAAQDGRKRGASAKAAAAAAATSKGRQLQQQQQQQRGLKPPLKPGAKAAAGKGAAAAGGAAAGGFPVAGRGGLGVYYHSQGANALGAAEMGSSCDDEVDEEYQRVSDHDTWIV
jgi:hypothetical protein